MERRENQMEIDDNLDWATLHEILKAKYDLNNLLIKYVDDENDEIDMNSQIEFENAYALASLTNSVLKFIIRSKSGQKLDQIVMNIHKNKAESIKPAAAAAAATAPVMEEVKLINFDTMFNLSTIIDSRIASGIQEPVARNTTDNNNNDLTEKNPPEWFQQALKNLKSEILNEIEDKLKPLYNKLEEFKIERSLNDSQMLSIEVVQKLINELDEANLLKDILRAKDIEEELTALNPFNAKFIRDCNIPDGTRFEINTKFRKSWLLQNNGRLAWFDSKVKLTNITGSIYTVNKTVNVPCVDVNGLIEIEVELIAPEKPGIYISEWALTYQNYMFGPRIWCAIEVVNGENKEVERITLLETSNCVQLQETQLAPLLPSPTPSSFNRKLSTSSRIDEQLKELVDLSDDENEFVIIPDCLDLTKKWQPERNNTSSDISIDSEFNVSKSDIEAEAAAQQEQREEQDKLNSTSTIVLLNELLLIPKREQELQELETRLQNLMTFSTDDNKNDDEINDSIEHIQLEQDLNDTIKEDEKNLLLFSNDYSNDQSVLYTNNAVASSTTTVATAEHQKVDKLLQISATALNTVLPSAPPVESPRTSLNLQNKETRFSLVRQNVTLDPADQLLAMGFANRTLNRKLLEKHGNDVEKVIEEILAKQDNDWASNRH